MNSEFEIGCAGWDVGSGFISESSAAARSGTRSLMSVTNQSYFGELWIRAASIPTTAGFVGDSLQILDNGQAASTDGPSPLENDWVPSTSTTRTFARFPDPRSRRSTGRSDFDSTARP